MHPRCPISGRKSCSENRDLLCAQVSHMGHRRILVLQSERSSSLPLSGTEEEMIFDTFPCFLFGISILLLL